MQRSCQVRAAFSTLFCLITTVAFTDQPQALQSFPAAVSPHAERCAACLAVPVRTDETIQRSAHSTSKSTDLGPLYAINGFTLSCTWWSVPGRFNRQSTVNSNCGSRLRGDNKRQLFKLALFQAVQAQLWLQQNPQHLAQHALALEERPQLHNCCKPSLQAATSIHTPPVQQIHPSNQSAIYAVWQEQPRYLLCSWLNI